MITSSAMQVILFGIYLLTARLCHCQIWSDPSSGIVVKTLYLPLRKNSSSKYSQNTGHQMQTFHIPYLPVKRNPDHQQTSSTLSQKHLPKIKFYETSIQDVRSKAGSYSKPELQVQVSNFHGAYPGSNFYQKHHNTLSQQSTGIPVHHNSEVQQQVYQAQPLPNHISIHPHYTKKNFTDIQYHNNEFININSVGQNAHSASVGMVPNIQAQISFGQQVYPSINDAAYKIPISNLPHSRNNQVHQVQSHQFGSSPKQQNVHAHSDANPSVSHIPSIHHPSYASSSHQSSFAIQNQRGNQHLEHLNINGNHHQVAHGSRYTISSQNQQDQQAQPAISTYAIVHQKIPNSNSAIHDNRDSFMSQQAAHVSKFKQGTESPTHTLYINNGAVEYIKTSPNPEMTFQMTPQNHLAIEVPHNSVENSQYSVKQENPSHISNHHNGYTGTQVQLMIPQFSQGHHESMQEQYFPQQSSSGYQTIRNHDAKSRLPQQQNLIQQTSYPDPASETFYSENKQVYVSPPADYSQGQQQQQTSSEQNIVRYPSHSETNIHYTQIPGAGQAEQLGIHIAIPSRNFAEIRQ